METLKQTPKVKTVQTSKNVLNKNINGSKPKIVETTNTTPKKVSTLSKVNNEWKSETKSLSAICRYINAQSDIKNSKINQLIDEINAKHKTKLTAKYCSPRNLIKFANEKEQFQNAAIDKKNDEWIKGEPKQYFSIYVVLGRFFNRACKDKASK